MCVRARIRVPVVLHFAPLKCPAGGGEITGALKNGDRVVNRLSALMRESAVPKRLVGGGVLFRPLPGLVVIHQGPTRGATHADKQERHEHAGSGKWDTRQSGGGAKIHSLLTGSRANFKGVSIFRPEQLDPAEMDRAHQSPACAGCPKYNGRAGCCGERGSPSQSN